ncbi:MAG: hypothetical protein LKG31_03225 [Lactobacillus sp.]|nr:hypothetical protein [Lactobacillus sp.]
MARIITVGTSADEMSWQTALQDLRADDVLLLEPGFYDLPHGLDVANITVKGLGSLPEETTIFGYFQLEADCNFFNLENVCVTTKTANNSFYVDEDADTYLSLRNVIVRAGKDDVAAISAKGKCTLELYSCKVLGGSVSIFEEANFRLTIDDSLLDYRHDEYAALGLQGSGTAILTNTKVAGVLTTYPQADCELDLNNSEVEAVVLQGKAWGNLFNSKFTGTSDASFCGSDDAWLNIVNCDFAGGVLLDQNSHNLLQNSQVPRLLAGNQAVVTMTNCQISQHLDVQDQAKVDLLHCKLMGTPEFEYFIALSDQAELSGRDVLLNGQGQIAAVMDEAKIKLDIMHSQEPALEIKHSSTAEIKIWGLHWFSAK